MKAYNTQQQNSIAFARTERETSGSKPEITTHVEPPKQGGAAYLRCTGCGREVIGTDESRLAHREECPHYGRDQDEEVSH